MKPIKTVGVVGAGQMGSGIAQALLQANCKVILVDALPGAIQKASAGIKAGLARFEAKKILPEGSAEKFMQNLSGGGDLKAFSTCDLVVEAVTENSDIKLGIFRELDGIAPPDAILASNTSSISITKLGAQTKRPEQVCGLHFMNPVPLMKLVEIVPGLRTSKETHDRLEQLAHTLGKTTVCSKDYPGFIVNRILLPMINESIWAVYEGIGSPEDIDQAAQLGLNHPMGPLRLADLIGLDTCLSILDVLYREFGNPKYHPCPLLVKHVEAGYLGRKTKRGFYSYEG